MRVSSHAPLSLAVGLAGLLSLIFATSTAADSVTVGPIEIIRNDPASGNLVAIGSDLQLDHGSTNRDVVVILGNAEVDGVVRGRMVTVLGNVRLGPNAAVQRKMVLIGGELIRHPDSQFAGFDGVKIVLPSQLVTGLQDWVKHGLLLGRPLPHGSLWAWWVFGVVLIFFLFVGILTPQPVHICAALLEQRPLSSFLAGLLALLLLGPLLLLLAASVVGTLAIPFVLCGALAALILGQTGVNVCVGRRIGLQFGWRWLRSPAVELIVGTILIGLFFFIPVLGLLAWGIVAILGLGAAILSFARSLRSESENPGRHEIPPLKVTPEQIRSLPPESSSDPILLPRAGFWIRLAGTLLDLILIGTILNVVARDNPQGMFLIVWLLYHVVMWGWQGTTVGGLVFGLRIYKQTGERIGFGIATIRSMASFFSAVVLFLGFFWAGWNREKLSWHDIIAGTVVAKCPRGMVLN